MATAVQDTPINVNLITASNDTGWSFSGATARHVACNAGKLRFIFQNTVPGRTYNVTFQVVSISGGVLTPVIGNTVGANITTPGFKMVSLTATGTDSWFYSDANCVISDFNIQNQQSPVTNKQKNTIAFSQKTNKWVSYYTFVPDVGTALNTKVYTANQGNFYVHESGLADRNEFYGTQYQSILQFVDNIAPAVPKTFQSLSIQSNELMITTSGGITTSLGQISELSMVDFVKDMLSDGVSTVNVNTIEGVFSANFLRDMNTDLLNGDVLRGNYLIVELISTTNEALLLYTINVVSRHSFIGAR